MNSNVFGLYFELFDHAVTNVLAGDGQALQTIMVTCQPTFCA